MNTRLRNLVTDERWETYFPKKENSERNGLRIKRGGEKKGRRVAGRRGFFIQRGSPVGKIEKGRGSSNDNGGKGGDRKVDTNVKEGLPETGDVTNGKEEWE